jgi:hypothetical protein
MTIKRCARGLWIPSLWLCCSSFVIYTSSAQASDTAFSQHPTSNLVIAHWFLHALFASVVFHKVERRRDFRFCVFAIFIIFRLQFLKKNDGWSVVVTSQPFYLNRIPLLRSITSVNSVFGHGSRYNPSPLFVGFILHLRRVLSVLNSHSDPPLAM